MIAIIDYDAGNIQSVENALHFIGEDAVTTRDPHQILSADKVILPGVGAFSDAMEKLDKYKLISTVHQVIDKKLPFLGICLGLHLLFEKSEEGQGTKGLGILKGSICRIPNKGLKVPHMGWNSLSISQDSKLFKDIKNNTYVYFVHSYYLKAEEEAIVSSVTEYGTLIHASIEKENIFACQFHPEKSGEAGLAILRNFATFGRESL